MSKNTDFAEINNALLLRGGRIIAIMQFTSFEVEQILKTTSNKLDLIALATLVERSQTSQKMTLKIDES